MKAAKEIVFLGLIFTSSAFANLIDNPDESVRAIFLRENPEMRLNAPEAEAILVQIRSELLAAASVLLTEEGMRSFSASVHFDENSMVVNVDEELNAALRDLVKESGNSVPYPKEGVGVETFDEYAREWGVSGISRFVMEPYYILVFSGPRNVPLAEKDFEEKLKMRADQNWRVGEARFQIERLQKGEGVRRQSVFLFSAKWGGCPSGCLWRRHFYLEVGARRTDDHRTVWGARMIGSTGNELQENLKALFK